MVPSSPMADETEQTGDEAASGEDQDPDLDVIAPLVVDYYKWLSGHSARGPEEFLVDKKLTLHQRQLFLDRCDDVNLCWSITSPLRNAARRITDGDQTIN